MFALGVRNGPSRCAACWTKNSWSHKLRNGPLTAVVIKSSNANLVSSCYSTTKTSSKTDILVPPTDPSREYSTSKLAEDIANEEKALGATKVGALVNVALAASKGIVGYGVGSAGLIADAVNSAGDIITDSIVYVTVRLSRSGISEKRPWGTGKLEPLGTLCVGAILLVTGFGLGHNSLTAAIDIAEAARSLAAAAADTTAAGTTTSASVAAEAVRSSSGSVSNAIIDVLPTPGSGGIETVAGTAGPSWTVFGLECTPWNLSALGVSLGAMASKEWLFRYTLKAGEAARSSVVITNAWQHRADVGVSTAVFVGVLGGMGGYPLLDPLAGLLVSGMIARQGILAVVESVQELTDISATTEELQALSDTCRSISGVKQVVSLTARKSGPYLFAELTIGVAGVMSASAAHRLAELTRAKVLQEHQGRVVECLVHVDPLGATGLGERAPLMTRDFDSISAEIRRALLTPTAVTATESSTMSTMEQQQANDSKNSGGTAAAVGDRLVINRGNNNSSSSCSCSCSSSSSAAEDTLASLVRLGEQWLGVQCPDSSTAARGAFVRRHIAFYVTGISEIQLYYLDSGYIGIKMDVYMNPRVSIREAHTLAVLTRQHVKEVLPGVAEVDVDLELDSVIAERGEQQQQSSFQLLSGTRADSSGELKGIFEEDNAAPGAKLTATCIEPFAGGVCSVPAAGPGVFIKKRWTPDGEFK